MPKLDLPQAIELRVDDKIYNLKRGHNDDVPQEVIDHPYVQAVIKDFEDTKPGNRAAVEAKAAGITPGAQVFAAAPKREPTPAPAPVQPEPAAPSGGKTG